MPAVVLPSAVGILNFECKKLVTNVDPQDPHSDFDSVGLVQELGLHFGKDFPCLSPQLHFILDHFFPYSVDSSYNKQTT